MGYPCPTCGNKWSDYGGTLWCGRCGSIETPGGSDMVPQLVERCREYGRRILAAPTDTGSLWNIVGIAESIHPPGERDAS